MHKFTLNFKLIIILTALLFLSLVTGLIISIKANNLLNQKIAETKEAERPAEIEIIGLKESSCPDCYNLTPLLEKIKKENVKIQAEKSLEITSPEGLELIKKFNITKAPSLLITGEIEKIESLKTLWAQIGEIQDNTFILRQIGGPYVLTDSGDVKGRIEITLIEDKNCAECYQATIHQKILQGYGLSSLNPKTLMATSKEGQELIKKYKIKLIPTFILTGDVETYPSLKSIWEKVGTIEKDSSYIFREGVKQMGIYKDLATGQIVKPEPKKEPEKNE